MRSIELKYVWPTYLSESDVDDSHIYNVAQLTFKKGQKYLIQAHSGRGKTSFLNLIYGMNQNYHGEIIYHPKQEATDFQQIRKKSLSYVFQELQLFEELTAFENIEIKNRLIKYLPTNDINAMLEKAGLIEKRNTLLGQLSFGQRQRIAIIRALCQPFDFLLMDEPFSHLDLNNQKTMLSLVEAEASKQGAGLILTSLNGMDFFQDSQLLKL